jgi:hypothetical protein
MRMIVEAFKETLELGLQKPKQIVVCINSQLGVTTARPKPLYWTLFEDGVHTTSCPNRADFPRNSSVVFH